MASPSSKRKPPLPPKMHTNERKLPRPPSGPSLPRAHPMETRWMARQLQDVPPSQPPEPLLPSPPPTPVPFVPPAWGPPAFKSTQVLPREPGGVLPYHLLDLALQIDFSLRDWRRLEEGEGPDDERRKSFENKGTEIQERVDRWLAFSARSEAAEYTATKELQEILAGVRSLYRETMDRLLPCDPMLTTAFPWVSPGTHLELMIAAVATQVDSVL